VLVLFGCSTSPSKRLDRAPVSISSIAEAESILKTPSIAPSLKTSCEELPFYVGTGIGEMLDNTLTIISMYTVCKAKQQNLSKAATQRGL
jgi:hypothetical protein